MPITLQNVKSELEPDELDYPAIAQKLGAEAIPYLKQLVDSPDPMTASKATYLASLIKNENAVAVLKHAATHAEPTVRVAAASGIRNLAETDADSLSDILIQDKDVGVRKTTLNSMSHIKSKKLTAKAKIVSEKDPEPLIREIANKIAKRKQ